MDSKLPLSPWASDDFFLLVRRLPGWPQAMWGHRLLLLRDQRVQRFATHASWRTYSMSQRRRSRSMRG